MLIVHIKRKKKIMKDTGLKLVDKEKQIEQKYLLLKMQNELSFCVKQPNGILEAVQVKVDSSNGICGFSPIFNSIEELRKFDAKADFIPVKVGE